MKELNAQELVVAVGGAKQSDQLTQTLTEVQSSIKDLASNKDSGTSSTTTMLMMAMMMNRPQPTVVAAAPAATPVINVSARLRRW